MVADQRDAAPLSRDPASSVQQLCVAGALLDQTMTTGRCQPGYVYSPTCAVGEACLELPACLFQASLIQKVPQFPGVARMP